MENYGSFIISVAIFCLLGVLVICKELSWTSILLSNLSKIYDESVIHLLEAKKKWIDQNPSNRIVYLLTKDQAIVDNDLIRTFLTVFDTIIINFMIFISLNYLYPGIFLIISIGLGYMAYRINHSFKEVSQRQLAFVIKSRTEMIDIYLETFDNLTMLRDYSMSSYYTDDFY